MNECIIVGAGSFFGLRRPPEPGDLLIAADGGYRHCRQAGLTPDLLLGDFDSLPQLPQGIPLLRLPEEKDDTDMLRAIKEGLARGYKHFQLYGGTGGRLDHTLANLQSLLYLARRGAQGVLYDQNMAFTALTGGGRAVLCGHPGDLFSLFSLEAQARDVCIRGGQYPLEHAQLTADFPLGVSNHFLDETAEVSLGEGALLLGWQLPGTLL